MHRRLGLTLLYGGAVVCALGALGFALGITVTISEALAWKIVRAAAYAAPLLVGVALMGGGAWILRATRAGRTTDTDRRADSASAPRAFPAERMGDAAPPAGRARRGMRATHPDETDRDVASPRAAHHPEGETS
ncbi:hypothetical protein [Roseisolibacter agri]|uniref:Uncharacterized protein n=1 Tax=Roseisolibacter agri TaxID=2014610 RepID=A0AA37QA47_9BACT|nr:hypothetical protein [Roseisolibacter agri]GLC25891.1 hypothetical protein rosag_24040 [Roseisolibacter agri]